MIFRSVLKFLGRKRSLWIFCSALAGISCSRQPDGRSELVIYTYTSFVSEEGAGPALKELFQRRHPEVEIQFRGIGIVEAISQLVLEGDRQTGGILLGFDEVLWATLRRENLFVRIPASRLPNLKEVDPALLFDPERRALPYDYSYFSFNYDSQVLEEPPASLDDLLEERFAAELVLSDPRSSTPGLGLLYWTIAARGDDFLEYWRQLKPSIRKIAPDWSTSYNIYRSGDASVVLSYVTSPIYHRLYEDTDRYRSADFPAGHYRQIEGFSILKGEERLDSALQFADFLFSVEAQKILAEKNIMLPVTPRALETLPPVFARSIPPEPARLPPLDLDQIEKKNEKWLTDWTRTMLN